MKKRKELYILIFNCFDFYRRIEKNFKHLSEGERAVGQGKQVCVEVEIQTYGANIFSLKREVKRC